MRMKHFHPISNWEEHSTTSTSTRRYLNLAELNNFASKSSKKTAACWCSFLRGNFRRLEESSAWRRQRYDLKGTGRLTSVQGRRAVQRTEGHTNMPINMVLGKIGHSKANLILFSAHLILVMHRSNILDVRKVFWPSIVWHADKNKKHYRIWIVNILNGFQTGYLAELGSRRIHLCQGIIISLRAAPLTQQILVKPQNQNGFGWKGP